MTQVADAFSVRNQPNAPETANGLDELLVVELNGAAPAKGNNKQKTLSPRNKWPHAAALINR